jgi:hypothetical protein
LYLPFSFFCFNYINLYNPFSLWLSGGVKLLPELSLLNTPVPHTPAKAANTKAAMSVSRLLRYKARPHASNMFLPLLPTRCDG